MGTNDTSNQQPDIINTLLNAGASQQSQQNTGNVLKGLLSLLQPTPNPQSANASLGASTTNVLNNAAQFTGNPAMAAGNYDATQNTGINQDQLAQTLQRLGQGGAGITNQPQQGLGGVQTVLPTDNHAKIMQGLIDKSIKTQGQQAINTYGTDTMQKVVDAHNATSTNSQGQKQSTAPSSQTQPTSNSTSTPSPSGVSNPGDKIQEQAMNIAMQKPGILGNLFKGMFEANQSAQLNILKQAQEITQGGPPLSQAQKTEAMGNWNSSLLQQHKDFQADLSGQMKSNVDAMESFVKNTPTPTKLSQWTDYNDKLQQYHTNIKDIAEKQLQGYNQFTQLQLTNPLTKNKESVSSQGNQYADISPDMARQEIANRIRNRQRGNQ